MKVSELQKAVKLLGRISNASSVSMLCRSFELSDNGIRACSEWGNIEMWIATGAKLTSPVLLNTAAFAGVLNSLPEDGELSLVQEGQQVKWSCGSAKGSWSLVEQDQAIPYIDHTEFPWTPPSDLGEALLIGSSACQAVTVSIGIFGVVLEEIDGKLRITSSNSTSLISSAVAKDGYSGGKVTLRPPVPNVLATILAACGQAKIDVTQQGIFIVGPWLVAQLPISTPLDQDLTATLAKFPNAVYQTDVDKKSISKFVARAQVLAGKGQTAQIIFKVSEGKLSLEHTSVGASTEEFFLASGLDPTWTFASVSVPIDLMASSLQHVDSAVLDYLAQEFLIFTGKSPEFKQIIGGQRA